MSFFRSHMVFYYGPPYIPTRRTSRSITNLTSLHLYIEYLVNSCEHNYLTSTILERAMNYSRGLLVFSAYITMFSVKLVGFAESNPITRISAISSCSLKSYSLLATRNNDSTGILECLKPT